MEDSQQTTTILIVEDEPAWHEDLQRVFRSRGWHLLHAFDYSDALNQLQQCVPAPDLAIVDLKLPSSFPQPLYDGLAVLTALRAKSVYAVVLSAVLREVAEAVAERPEVCDVVDKLRFSEAGFLDYFLAKIDKALAYARACRRAEGQLREQHERLNSLPQQYACDLFLSHASEDKDDIARPLYEALTAHHVTVWFDEAALELGDSLRRKIDEGLRRCRFGLVVLSPHFFQKQWPQWELDGLVTRETSSGAKAILPVWHHVEKHDVAAYSEPLADRVAAKSSEGIDTIVKKILRALGA
jgi:CheY-like chemotaxis protein